MKLTTPKYLNIGFLLLLTLTFSNCTAWPAVAALLGLAGGKGGGGLMIIPPGGSDASTDPATSVGGSTGIGFSSSSSTNIETSPNVTVPVVISTSMNATVDYTVTGTATGGGVDYTLANGTLTFTNGGATTQNITFTIVNDALFEANETVIITLSNPTGTTLGANTVHTYTIVDDDSASIAFDAVSSSGAEGVTNVTIPVSISDTTGASVNYSVTGGTATDSGADYTLASGTLTFINGGATTQNITFTVNDDALYENDETIEITLSSPTGANLGVNTIHTYTITNDDVAPTVGFTATSSNGFESVTSPIMTVTLSAPSALTTIVDYAVSGASTASAGVDYTLSAGTLTFPAGTTSLNITPTIVNDLNTELDETVIIILSNATNSTLGNSSHLYTIEDNDAPSISFSATTSVGSEATGSVNIPVSVSAPYSGTVTVDYSVTGGTATGSGTDYTLSSGTLVFASGVSTQNINVTIVNDTFLESNETIVISLSNPTAGSSLGANVNHTYTIVDEDTASVEFTANASSGSEATTSVTIPVSISQTATASVNYSVTGGTATGSGTDYTLASGTLNFTSGGATTQNISITINNDALNELEETIIITLSSPSAGLNLGVNSAHTYTITNDDVAPTVAFSAATSSGSETVTAVTIPVTLTGNTTAQTVTVGYSVTGGTATGSGTDFTLASGTLTFTPGTTSQNISISVINDSINETNETIQVTLATPTVATLGTDTVHTYTIADNDTAPTVAFSATTSSGSEATTSVSIPVSLTGNATAQTVTVDYSVTGGTATGTGTDYTLASGTLTFNAGTTSQNIDVTVVNDLLNETNETIIVTLANPTISTLGTNTTHTYTITDNDTAPSVAFGAATSNGAESVTSVSIPVSLIGNSTTQAVTVDYSISGTATGSGTDYTLAAGTLKFNNGTTYQNIDITVVNDGINETNETIIMTLANPSIVTLGAITGHTYTIVDDDTPSIAFNATSSNASETTTTVTIPVTISLTANSSVDYTVTGGTATGSGADFTLAAGTLNFTNGGAMSQDISILVNNDTLYENDETIVITLSNPSNANLGGNTVHTYTITNDDAMPTVEFTSASQSSVGETGTMTITAQLSATSGLAVTVPFTVNGSSTATGADYSLSASPITIPAGSTTGTATITITSDTLDEANETVVLDMGVVTNATASGTTTHTATITDDDAAPTVSFTAASQLSAGETGTMTITAELSAVSVLAGHLPCP